MEWFPELNSVRLTLAILLTLLLILYWYTRIPNTMPKNIPTVPIYISLLGLWSDMGQDKTYDRWLRQPLEKYGAVKIWFAGRWNVLATRPQFLVDMFRHEDVYAKAGSQKKIPWSVIAALVGDNIINSHGETWRLFTAIMKPGLQRRITESGPLLEKSRKFVDVLLEEQWRIGGEKGFLVNPIIQRWALSCMGICFMGVDLEVYTPTVIVMGGYPANNLTQALERPGQRLEELQSIIKKTLFKPLFFNFPDLDRYPFIFRQRKIAFAIMQEFGDLLCKTVRQRPHQETKSPDGDQVVDYLDRALKEGRITEEQYRANIKVTFLTAHENAQQLLNSTFWVLGTNTSSTPSHTYSPSSSNYSVYTPRLTTNQPRNDLYLRARRGNLHSNHTWVGWNAFGVHTDPNIWGDNAREFLPERWGSDVKSIQSAMRRKTTQCHFIAFNAHSRKCLGQGFAVLQMKILLFEMVRRIEWIVDPGYELKLTSGGIMAPLGLRAIVRERGEVCLSEG
ncbi:Cytochrome monooxygenase xanG [Penicillium cataractarum]|uniref:Cytochrome monooxygenase xanG n=1 Tax=Penicillium cataractarum TaxID=2100454 RepID=A0A9W9VTJ1_9EURO|nr:Cytochrome monooxygenase xanG [Penicillium cataractarum]KAJ5389048.1 Cytochrome monooxygenase xanG [Penicillium cataractarum]